MNGKSDFFGKLPPEILHDMDSLLLELKRRNRKVLRQKIIRRSDIVPLAPDKYVRLWGYIRHCCHLVSTWPNVRKAIETVAQNSGRLFVDVREECVDTMTLHVYSYAWRKYVHSDDCGLVFSTAIYGYKTWITSQNAYDGGVRLSMAVFEADNCNGASRVMTQTREA